MLSYPLIDPVAFHLGPLAVHWYGLMYLVGLGGAWAVLAWRIKKSSFPRCLTLEQLSDVIFWAAMGIIIGGRLGYMVFYDFDNLLSHPARIFEIWKGGMAFHGGLLGVIIAIWIYALKTHKHFADITDFIAPAVPIGLAAGRIGNFINGELWGRVTDVPWAMIFPDADKLPRHPSQLYEFFLEGMVLFFILWIYSSKPRPRWAVSGLFLVCYGLFRFVIEFFREPDVQIGFVAWGWMSKGQLLCLPMIIIGLVMMVYSFVRKLSCNNT